MGAGAPGSQHRPGPNGGAVTKCSSRCRVEVIFDPPCGVHSPPCVADEGWRAAATDGGWETLFPRPPAGSLPRNAAAPPGHDCYTQAPSWSRGKPTAASPGRRMAGRRTRPAPTATGGSTSPPAGSVVGDWRRPGPLWPGHRRSRTPGPTPPERHRRVIAASDRHGRRGRYRRVRAIPRRTTRLRRGRQAPHPQLRRPRLLPRRQRGRVPGAA